MRRVVGWMLMVIGLVCGVAHADGGKGSGKTARWEAVETLSQGAVVEVGREGLAGVETCRVVSADDSALTCIVERLEGDARLVFPRGSVKDVWVIERAKNLHIGRWIFVGMGAALVVAAGVGGGVFGLAFVGPIVVGIEISYFEDYVWRQPPQPPRMRQRLVYSV
jgi:hypothetical protein